VPLPLFEQLFLQLQALTCKRCCHNTLIQYQRLIQEQWRLHGQSLRVKAMKAQMMEMLMKMTLS
jgi:hypothetical protein